MTSARDRVTLFYIFIIIMVIIVYILYQIYLFFVWMHESLMPYYQFIVPFGILIIIFLLSRKIVNYTASKVRVGLVCLFIAFGAYSIFFPIILNIIQNWPILFVVINSLLGLFSFLVAYTFYKSINEPSLKANTEVFCAVIVGLVLIGSVLIGLSGFESATQPNAISQTQSATTSPVQPTGASPDITPVPSTAVQLRSCGFIGIWTQTRYENTPVTGVYIRIYPDNRIEIYLNNQLRSWGAYETIAPNQIRHTWTGGVDTGTGDTITITPDCQTLEVVSFRGEHSTFVRQ